MSVKLARGQILIASTVASMIKETKPQCRNTLNKEPKKSQGQDLNPLLAMLVKEFNRC